MIDKPLIQDLWAYNKQGLYPGKFLTSVLENDLRQAVLQANAEELAALPEIIRYIDAEIPKSICGSREKVRAYQREMNHYYSSGY